jgi:hypothetical protein
VHHSCSARIRYGRVLVPWLSIGVMLALAYLRITFSDGVSASI